MFGEGRQRKARERAMLRRLRELDRIDAQYGLGTLPSQVRVVPPHIRRRRRVAYALLGATGVGLAVDDVVGNQLARDFFTLAGERLAEAPGIPDTDGSYQFTATQPGGVTPVSYNPCRPIRYAVNPSHAPDGYASLVETAVEHISEATGFVFEYVGESGSRAFEPVVIGSATSIPVLIAWAPEDEVDRLSGDTVGIGGSVKVELHPGFDQYVTGVVVLEAEHFDDLADRGDRAHAQAIVDHEFGHLVGLDHVDDTGELMNAENLGRTEFGIGDLEGLARLGNVTCR